MKYLVTQVRLYLAERCLALALRFAPNDTDEALYLCQALKGYYAKTMPGLAKPPLSR